ncbi:Sterol regulatory element-binding protein 2 [Kickxella alabastrina]|uniref:Sterol regulatory element-binding protein 2 n=1 Tax=Kickxella alabastrina TaxID=61397 RepID=A0ACC1I1N3_9FUNG|nr:Sterol regulatory element-binding protein 2 [Kickxella alabastrina]
MPQYQNSYYQHPPAPRAGQAYHGAPATAAHNSREPAMPLYMQPGRLSLSTSTSPTAPKGSGFMQIPGRPLTAEEKEIKRKVSHSAIEKRRRERTNSVLSELQNIVPGLSKPGKIQKLEILEAAAKYIRQLTAGAGVRKQTSSKHHHGLNKHTQQMQYHDQGFQEGSQDCHHDYQPRVNQQHQPKTFDKFSPFHSHSRIPERAVSDEPLDQQHIAIATPTSVYYNTSADESTDEATSNAQSRPLAASASSTPSASSTLPADPSSMKVNFLLC